LEKARKEFKPLGERASSKKNSVGLRRPHAKILTLFMTKICELRTEFLLEITAIKFYGFLNCEILGRQTKVAQRFKHAIPCHAFRNGKSTMRSWKSQ